MCGTDYGTLTLLFQDSVNELPEHVSVCHCSSMSFQVGGLEVQNPHTGAFVPATPIVRDRPRYFWNVF